MNAHFSHVYDAFDTVKDDFATVNDVFGIVHDDFSNVNDVSGAPNDDFGTVNIDFFAVNDDFGAELFVIYRLLPTFRLVKIPPMTTVSLLATNCISAVANVYVNKYAVFCA